MSDQVSRNQVADRFVRKHMPKKNQSNFQSFKIANFPVNDDSASESNLVISVSVMSQQRFFFFYSETEKIICRFDSRSLRPQLFFALACLYTNTNSLAWHVHRYTYMYTRTHT